MARLLRTLKTGLLILGITILFLFCLNVAVAILLRFNPSLGAPKASGLGETTSDPRAELPSYEDHELARKIYEEAAQIGTRFVPFIEWQAKPLQGEVITVGKEGDRVWDSTSDGAKVAHFFGGSTMFGSGSPDEETIPALFETQRREYRAQNHGQSSYISRQNFERLINLMNEGERIDLAVFYDGANEVAVLCDKNNDLNGHAQQRAMASALEVHQTDRAEPSFLDSLRSLLVGRIQILVAHFIQPGGSEDGAAETDAESIFACAEDPTRARAVAETLLSNWKRARDLVSSSGGTFIGILQPVAYVGDPYLKHISDLTPGLASGYKDLGDQFDAVYPIIEEEIRSRGWDWAHDLTTTFDRETPIYVDFAHVAPSGNRLIADRIAAIVNEAAP